MLKRLPPAGNPVLAQSSTNPEACFESVFGHHAVFMYGSGTMALAAALIAAKEAIGVSKPEVLIPAYACPDLVSAAIYAGVRPVLVDLELNRPWMDLKQLRARITSNTIAVIAVHFLGLSERLGQIRNLLAGTDILLIEDSAQLFPRAPGAKVWQGDLVILSFGRGKPVSLLGGGALICRKRSLVPHLPLAIDAALHAEKSGSSIKFAIKARLYNQLLAPYWYGILSSLPFLNLGETCYIPLNHISSPGARKSALLATNITAYQKWDGEGQRLISSLLEELASDRITDISREIANDPTLPLLRYPLLIKTAELRDLLLKKLSLAGLGASRMYPTPLPEIPGLTAYFQDQNGFQNAKAFSEKLLTLPCHSGVTAKVAGQIRKVIAEWI